MSQLYCFLSEKSRKTEVRAVPSSSALLRWIANKPTPNRGHEQLANPVLFAGDPPFWISIFFQKNNSYCHDLWKLPSTPNGSILNKNLRICEGDSRTNVPFWKIPYIVGILWVIIPKNPIREQKIPWVNCPLISWKKAIYLGSGPLHIQDAGAWQNLIFPNGKQFVLILVWWRASMLGWGGRSKNLPNTILGHIFGFKPTQ